ncbi:PqqD family protein [Spirillospora sp. CA-294931]|uniref:PqqD family protein n=1 Tax=Spirillospora sp. CA-294931 TaxID=3240042 RepID=UPI003D8C34D6
MPLLRLAEYAVFDDTDDSGIILDTRKGVYLSLNGVATAMLKAALRFDTADKVIDSLRERIDASDDTLESGLDALVVQLEENALLAPEPEQDRTR